VRSAVRLTGHDGHLRGDLVAVEVGNALFGEVERVDFEAEMARAQRLQVRIGESRALRELLRAAKP
jgi:hypothetical protein